MTEKLQQLIWAITCRRCNGEGTLHSRIGNPPVTMMMQPPFKYIETHRPCDVCGGDGKQPMENKADD